MITVTVVIYCDNIKHKRWSQFGVYYRKDVNAEINSEFEKLGFVAVGDKHYCKECAEKMYKEGQLEQHFETIF